MTEVLESKFKYKAFISYSHRDDEWAAWLLKALERYRIPNHIRHKHARGPLPKRLGPFFRDRDELPATGHMTDRIFQALAESEHLIVICSPDATRSKLVNREIAEFKRVRRGGQILCVIVRGIPFSDNPAEECFPDALRLEFTSDGARSGLAAESLAADARDEGDGRRYATLKLVAGLLGVGLNDLVRRDNQFRHRRIAILATAATVGMAAMAALALDARNARDKAENALLLAEQKNNEAQQSKGEMIDFTRFVVTSVYDELVSAGSLSVLERTSKKIVDRLDHKGIENLEFAQLTQLIGAYLRLGQALERQGESTYARQYFETARKWAHDLYKLHPNNEVAIARYATSLFFTGYLSRRQGDYVNAEADYIERLRLSRVALEGNLEVDPHAGLITKAQWKEEVADALANLCNLQYQPLGKPLEALENCKSSVALRHQIVESVPSNRERWINLASAYFFLANNYLVLDRNIEAKEALLTRRSIYANILDEDPKNYRVLRRAAMTEQLLASIEVRQGRLDNALERLRVAQEEFDTLTAQDPANVMWRANSADVYRDKAALHLRLQDVAEASKLLETADEQITSALSADMTRTERRLVAHETRLLKAELMAVKGDKGLARQYLLEALAHFEGEDPDYLLVPGAMEFAERLYLMKGDMAAKDGDTETAMEAWQQVVTLFENCTATKTPAVRQSAARAYKNLGQHERADAVVSKSRTGR